MAFQLFQSVNKNKLIIAIKFTKKEKKKQKKKKKGKAWFQSAWKMVWHPGMVRKVKFIIIERCTLPHPKMCQLPFDYRHAVWTWSLLNNMIYNILFKGTKKFMKLSKTKLVKQNIVVLYHQTCPVNPMFVHSQMIISWS